MKASHSKQDRVMSSTPTTSQKLPILENGDRVTREEFEQR
jgi:hypothetical protein